MRRINKDTEFDVPTGTTYVAEFKREQTQEAQTDASVDVVGGFITARIGKKKDLHLAFDMAASKRRRVNRTANEGREPVSTYTE